MSPEQSLLKLAASWNKSKGHNEIHPELINKASPEFLNTLVIFMNAFFQLCHLPLKGITKPIVKDSK